MLTRADKWLIGIVLLLAACGIGTGIFLFPPSASQSAEIMVDGKLVKTIQLRQGYREELRIGGNEHYDIIEVQDNRIRIREADCPDQVCVHTGWISTVPQQIVCLPWRVVIKIVSTEALEIDDIAR